MPLTFPVPEFDLVADILLLVFSEWPTDAKDDGEDIEGLFNET